jgi:hypothetical protein
MAALSGTIIAVQELPRHVVTPEDAHLADFESVAARSHRVRVAIVVQADVPSATTTAVPRQSGWGTRSWINVRGCSPTSATPWLSTVTPRNDLCPSLDRMNRIRLCPNLYQDGRVLVRNRRVGGRAAGHSPGQTRILGVDERTHNDARTRVARLWTAPTPTSSRMRTCVELRAVRACSLVTDTLRAVAAFRTESNGVRLGCYEPGWPTGRRRVGRALRPFA